MLFFSALSLLSPLCGKRGKIAVEGILLSPFGFFPFIFALWPLLFSNARAARGGMCVRVDVGALIQRRARKVHLAERLEICKFDACSVIWLSVNLC